MIISVAALIVALLNQEKVAGMKLCKKKRVPIVSGRAIALAGLSKLLPNAFTNDKY